MMKSNSDKKIARKGLVYTLFAIAFLAALMLFISLQKTGNSGSEIAGKIRADEVLSFAHSVSGDLERGAFISGRKALLSLTNSIIEGNGTFPLNADISAKELAINGTLNGIQSDIMENSTLVDWSESIMAIGNEERLITNFSIISTELMPASSFEIAFRNNVSTYIYDPLAKITYNRTALSTENIPIDQLEDPYVAVKSLGTSANSFKRCASFDGAPYSGAWAYGKIYASNQTDFSGVSGQSDKVLVTNSTVGKTGYSNFKAIVTETATDPAEAKPYIFGVSGAVGMSKNNTYAVISSGTFWLTNDTSCYFEAPDGPSFFDRLEGRGEISQKYSLPGKITGLGSFILTYSCGRALDYAFYEHGTCA